MDKIFLNLIYIWEEIVKYDREIRESEIGHNLKNLLKNIKNFEWNINKQLAE